MGYKILGFLVWRGGRLYLARKYPNAPRKIAIGGATAAAVGAAIAFAARSRAESQ
jgi:hypothetical protein